MIFSTFPEMFPSMKKFDFCNRRNGRNGCHVIEVEISKKSHEDHFLGQFSTLNRMVLFPEAHFAGVRS